MRGSYYQLKIINLRHKFSDRVLHLHFYALYIAYLPVRLSIVESK